jgi:hypothetical protein
MNISNFAKILLLILTVLILLRILYLRKNKASFSFNFIFSSSENLLFLIISFEILNFISELLAINPIFIVLIQILLFFLSILNVFKRFIFFNLLKKNYIKKNYFKKSFIKNFILHTNNAFILPRLFLVFLITKIKTLYKKYPVFLFLFLLTYCYIVKNILLVSIFFFHWLYDSILDLPEFLEIKRVRTHDIHSFNFHWSFDRDLKLWNSFITFFYLVGFVITYFSYFVYVSSLGPVADEYTFFLINLTVSPRDIQYFLGMNFIGPIVLMMCVFLKLFLNLHVIFFRNPSTIYKGFATISTTVNILGFSSLVVGVVGTGLGFGSFYNAGPSPDNMAKNSFDSVSDGVIRHTVVQEKAFVLAKKTGLKIIPEEVTESPSNKILDLNKLHLKLSLKENLQYLEQIPAVELHALGFTDLISEIKLLRHNLLVYTNIDNGFTKENYIARFNTQDKENRLMFGISAPSKEELHSHYAMVAATLCKSPEDILKFEEFITGKSDKLYYSLNFQKEFGFLSTKRSINSVYVESKNPLIKTDLERIALKIPQLLQEQKRIGNIPLKEEENLGEYLTQQINKPLPLLIKNEPENP